MCIMPQQLDRKHRLHIIFLVGVLVSFSWGKNYLVSLLVHQRLLGFLKIFHSFDQSV